MHNCQFVLHKRDRGFFVWCVDFGVVDEVYSYQFAKLPLLLFHQGHERSFCLDRVGDISDSDQVDVCVIWIDEISLECSFLRHFVVLIILLLLFVIRLIVIVIMSNLVFRFATFILFSWSLYNNAIAIVRNSVLCTI